MELLELKLRASSGAWRKYSARKQSKVFAKVKKAILIRDRFCCRFCGFFSKEHQEVINLDNDYDNNKYNNLVTSCSFCAQCLFLDSVGLEPCSGGRIIYLPEISQIDLNNFIRVLFCSMDKETSYKAKLQSTYISLKNRIKPVEYCFGPHTSDPTVFGRGLIDSNLNPNELKHKLLNDLRLLPSKTSFKHQIEYWKKTIFSNVSF